MERDRDMESFYDIHICDWEGLQCEEWANYVCRKRGVDVTEVDLRGFRVTDGIALQQQSRQELCVIVGDQYGAMFWKELRSFRAQQKQRCSKCVNIEEIPALIPWSTNHGAQVTATDLSSQSHTSQRSHQKSSSPRSHPYHTSPYSEQPSPVSYEVRTRYPEEHSPPRSYEGSPSPGYQERVRFQEDYSPYPPYLPPSPESCRSHSHSPQLMYPDQFYWKAHEESEHLPPPRKPLPELLPLEDAEEGSSATTPQIHHKTHVMDHWLAKDMRLQGSVEHKTNRPIQVIYSSHPTYPPHSSHSAFVAHQTQRNNLTDNRNRSHHPQIIQYAHPSRPGFPSHAIAHSRPVVHPNYRRNYAYGNHASDSSVMVYGSDEEEDGQDEPGRLVIDLDDNSSEMTEKESDGGVRSGQESSPYPHLKKIPTKRRRDRGPKSWEFLMRLLACPETNPSIIRWEDEAEGSFRLVQPQEIANMWGTRSKKEDLSYNNFARALRYHYKTKLLYKISERQLVYGCGPSALEFYRKLVSEEYKSQTSSSIG